MRNRFDFEHWLKASGSSRTDTAPSHLHVDKLFNKWFLGPVLRLMLWYRKSDRGSGFGMRYRSGSLNRPFQTISSSLMPIVDFPLWQHFRNRRAPLWHRLFRRQETNDSVVMLTDFLDVPGNVIPVTDHDHYLKYSTIASERVAGVLELFQPMAKNEPAHQRAVTARGAI
jgi:hypothetical protein